MAASTDKGSPQAPGGLGADLARRFRSNIQTYTIILALVAIWALFAALTNGAFLSAQNFSNLFRQMTVTSLLAVGMVFVIVTGGIDLSVGKLAGFVSVVAAYFQANVWYKVMPDQPLVAAIISVILAVGVGVLFGMLQGYIIAYLNVPAFIVTLGGMFVLNGAILLVTEGKTIPANQPYFSDIAQSYLPPLAGWVIAAVVVVFLFWNMFRGRASKQRHGFELSSMGIDLLTTVFYSFLVFGYVYWVNQYRGIQTPVLLLAIVAIIMAYISNNTRFGRYAYAIGGNREAARLSGINIRRSIFLIFVLMGLLSGVAGVVLASYVGYGTTAAGQGYELDAIASAILGGTSTLGGVGTIFGALIGSLIMSSLTTGLQMLNVAPAWQYLVKGAVLVLAVYADVSFKKNR
jgi:D-xylose transport system permease protein